MGYLVTFARHIDFIRRHVLRRLLRRGSIDDLLIAPGPPVPLWPSAANLYEQGVKSIKQEDGGWNAPSCDPGHLFVSWEMAVRYEAACREALFHYIQICDGVTQDDFDRRIARITEVTAEAQRLSEIEQAARPLLPTEALPLRIMSSSPYPEWYPDFDTDPADTVFYSLVSDWLDDIHSELVEAISTRSRHESFSVRMLLMLTRIDREIPGPGIHSAVWNNNRYRYPFSETFEAVLRPLRYIPAYLGQAYREPLFIRAVLQMAGAHLEGCVKSMHRIGSKQVRYPRAPLGSLLRKKSIVGMLNEKTLEAMRTYTDLGVNPAKHNYTAGQVSGSLFTFEDAVYGYFLARRFGAAALEASDQLTATVAAVEDATAHRYYFRGAAMSAG